MISSDLNWSIDETSVKTLEKTKSFLISIELMKLLLLTFRMLIRGSFDEHWQIIHLFQLCVLLLLLGLDGASFIGLPNDAISRIINVSDPIRVNYYKFIQNPTFLITTLNAINKTTQDFSDKKNTQKTNQILKTQN